MVGAPCLRPCLRPWTLGAPSTTALSTLKYPFRSFRKSDYISPLDDLAFDMYQDPEVAQIIRKLDERKREAVQKERYDYAKKLKQAIADLQKVLLLERAAPPQFCEKAARDPDAWHDKGPWTFSVGPKT